MICRKVDHALFGGLILVLALLMRVPPFIPEPASVSAAEVFSGAWVQLRVEDPADAGADPTFVFTMRRTPAGGAYETHMSFEGRTFMLRGSISTAEFQGFMTGLEAHRASAMPCTCSDVMRSSRGTPRYVLHLCGTGTAVRDACLDDMWSPQYQSLERFLDRTIVGRSQEALKKAAGF